MTVLARQQLPLEGPGRVAPKTGREHKEQEGFLGQGEVTSWQRVEEMSYNEMLDASQCLLV